MPIGKNVGVYSSGALLGVQRQQLKPVSSGPVFPTGMVARWTLDDTSAGYVDLIGARTLTAVGTPPTTAAGVIGDAANFGGAGGLTTPDEAGLKLAAGFAVEVWSIGSYLAGGSWIIAKDSVAAGQREWLVLALSGKATFIAYNSVGSSFLAQGTTNIPTAAWSHLVATFDGANVRIYVNGVLEKTTAFTGSPRVTAVAMSLAQDAIGVGRLTGSIDEPAIWQFGASGDPGAAFWLDRYNSGLGRRP